MTRRLWPLVWIGIEVKHRAFLLGYWLRPYDAHLDARRWRLQESGCASSRRLWRETMSRQDKP